MNNSLSLLLYNNGGINRYFPIQYVTVPNIVDMKLNQTIRIKSNYDTYTLGGFLFPYGVNYSNITSLIIEIGGNIIFNISYKVWIATVVIKRLKDYLFIPFPIIFYKTADEFLIKNQQEMLCTTYHDIHITISGNDDFSGKMIINYNTYKEFTPRTLNKCIPIIQYQSYHNIQTNRIILNRSLPSTTGFYIKMSDQLENIKVIMNNIVVIDYNEIMINLYCQLLDYNKLNSEYLASKDRTNEDILSAISSLFNRDIVYIFGKYIINVAKTYFYYIPIGSYIDNPDDNITMNIATDSELILKTKNDIYDDIELYVKGKNILQYADGTAFSL